MNVWECSLRSRKLLYRLFYTIKEVKSFRLYSDGFEEQSKQNFEVQDFSRHRYFWRFMYQSIFKFIKINFATLCNYENYLIENIFHKIWLQRKCICRVFQRVHIFLKLYRSIRIRESYYYEHFVIGIYFCAFSCR